MVGGVFGCVVFVEWVLWVCSLSFVVFWCWLVFVVEGGVRFRYLVGGRIMRLVGDRW